MIQRKIIQAVTNLPPTFPGVSRVKELYPWVLPLQRCRTLDDLKPALRGLVVPNRECPCCVGRLSHFGRAPVRHTGKCTVFADDHSIWIVPTLHRTAHEQLTPEEHREVRVSHEMCESTFGLQGTRLLACIDDPFADTCTIGHVHFRVVSAQEYAARTQASKTEEDYQREYARLFGLLTELKACGGLTALFEPEIGVESMAN